MRPTVPLALADLARLLTAEIAPALPAGPVRGDLGMWAYSLNVLAEQWDSLVADLVEENARFEDLIEQAAARSSSPARERLADLAKARLASLRVPDLEARHAALLEGLIEVQSDIEQSGQASDAELDDAIWRELAAAAKRRRFSGGPF